MKGLPRLRTPHRIARINYLPRVLGNLATLMAIYLLAWERESGTTILTVATAYFLIYPQLAWLHTRLRYQSKQAEFQNMLFDCVALGMWTGALGFNLWLTFSLLSSSLLNSAMTGGLPRILVATLWFAAGSTAGFLLFAPGFQPDAGLLFTGFIFITTLLYHVGVGLTHFWQNRQLARVHKDIARKNHLFRALLDMGSLTHEATDADDLVDQALGQFRDAFPGEIVGIVLFHLDRPRLVRYMAFPELASDQREHLLTAVADHNESGARNQTGTIGHGDKTLRAIPMHRRLSQAWGYLVMNAEKPDDTESALPLFIDQIGAVLENKLLTQELRRAAETDGLTGLFNRSYLEEQLNEAIDTKKHYPAMDFAVIMIDLIGLKRTNDTHGHRAGDGLIRIVADRLAEQARNSDVAARFGGDEFVVLCRDCTEANAEKAVQRLGRACRDGQCRLTLQDGQEVTIAVEMSVGLAGSDRHPADRVLEVADTRMYENKVRWYEEHDRTRES